MNEQTSMSNPLPRLMLPLALCAALAACSDEPESIPAGPDAAAPVADAETRRAPAPPPKVSTPYERAVRTLTSGGSYAFESEVTLADGGSEYATGVAAGQGFSFGVRTLPKPNADHDGNWVRQSGRWFRESAAGYDLSPLVPGSVEQLTELLATLPQAEDMLRSDKPAAEIVPGGSCQPRSVDLSRSPQLMTRFSLLGVCVDEEKARLIRLEAKLQTGEQLRASFTRHDEPVQLPKVQVTDWSQEFPRR
jgi:hypothetical protein